MTQERIIDEDSEYVSNIQGSVTHKKGKQRGKHRSHVKGAARRNKYALHGRRGSGSRHIPKDAT